MTRTRSQNAKSRAAGGYKVLPSISRNLGASSYYRRAIQGKMDALISAIYARLDESYHSADAVMAVIQQYRTQQMLLFLQESEGVIRTWLSRAMRNTRQSLERSFGDILGDRGDYTLTIRGTEYEDILRMIVQRNVGLIQNTSMQTLNNIENIVYDGITTGQPWSAVRKDLNKQTHISRDRIKRIARDQTGKANEALNELVQRDTGIQFFEWTTAGDERVSTGKGGHKQLDGKIYKWGDTANYPIIDAYGHRGLPHQRVNCRCDARPVLLRKDYVARQTAEGDWIIEKGRL